MVKIKEFVSEYDEIARTSVRSQNLRDGAIEDHLDMMVLTMGHQLVATTLAPEDNLDFNEDEFADKLVQTLNNYIVFPAVTDVADLISFISFSIS